MAELTSAGLPAEVLATYDVYDLVMILHDMTWESFLSQPGRYLDQIVEWDYEPEDLGLDVEDDEV
ncbi:hypothetical protein [Paenibacillus sp. YIM B09110]|uniref:hypothetical protein n=1 Tax=Paenibacillus sp. YIM B09110 TaxID=3126102 RepID=UPI00301CB915